MVRFLLCIGLICLFLQLPVYAQLSIIDDVQGRSPQVFQLKLDTTATQYKTEELLSLYKLTNGQPAKFKVAGKYAISNDTLRFTPINQLQDRQQFHIITYNAVLPTLYTVPTKGTKNSLKVNNCYPLGNTVAKNTLIFYIEFDQEMLPVSKAYSFVDILDGNDQIIKFPWRQKSYWINNNRTLVLMIHPGRVKNGIQSTYKLDPIFVTGKTIKLKLQNKFQSINGHMMKTDYIKEYYIGNQDHKSPQITTTNIVPPQLNTTNTITLSFDEQMDYGLIHKWVKVYKASHQIKGTLSTKDGKTWFFTPLEAWKKGEYKLALANKLADPSHNQLDRLFEAKLRGEFKELSHQYLKFSL